MDISLDLYRVFRATAKAGSISKAARELYISQPAVSQAINHLEQRLNGRLFTRTPRGVVLTKEGEALYGYIDQACTLIESGERRIEQLRSLEGGEIRIGASDTLCKHFLLPRLEKFHKANPEISVRITNRTSRESIELMRLGQVDMAFVNMPLEAEGVDIQPCRTVRDCFVGNSKFKRHTAPISWRELAKMPLLLLEPLSNMRRIVDEFAESQGVVLKPEIELGSLDVLADFASIGLGIACVTRDFVSSDIESGRLFEIRVSPPLPARSIGLALTSGAAPSFAASGFIETVLQPN